MCKETTVRVTTGLTPTDPHNNPVIIIGQHKHLLALSYSDVAVKFEGRVSETVWNTGVKSLQPSPTDSASLYLNFCTAACLPSKISRHNTASRTHSITKIVRQHSVSSNEEYVVLVCERSNVYASVCGVARAYSMFTRKSSMVKSDRHQIVTIEFILVGDDKTPLTAHDVLMLEAAIHGVRMAARIVDTPANEMDTMTFVKEIKAVGVALNLTPTIIAGEELQQRGFGGIYGVGKAAIFPPVLAVLSYKPEGATQNIAWVGKGIVYDTGGLSMKTKTTMPGMKRDCGGAAGILGAFYLAVKSGFRENLHAVFCLAENAVGPTATKPDDIHIMYSGRSVEINNTDAEGRLVLGDGVVYAYKDLKCNVVIDMATLTGAQGTATGKYHAAIVTNCEAMETCAVSAGRTSGDLVHPLPYSPELHFNEFASSVADMKNSAADRNNAASSCAGLFIAAQLGFDFPGKWLHIDMASPVCSGERATGYGVALLAALFGEYSDNALLQSQAPALPDLEPADHAATNNNEDNSAPLLDQPSSKKTRLS